MWPLKKEIKTLPAHFLSTDMTPCQSRGRFKPYVYTAELFASAYAMTLSGPGLVFGSFFALHAVYRLFNMKKLQVPCPHCQAIQKGLMENGKSVKCKSCGHRLGIYGTKLADLESAGSSSNDQAQRIGDAGKETAAEKTPPQQIGSVVGGLAFIGLMIWLFGGGLDWQAGQMLQKIQNDVAADSVAEYGIAQRNGNRIDQCVQAGLVAAAYLQANDETNYALWKKTRDNDCAVAGVPPQ